MYETLYSPTGFSETLYPMFTLVFLKLTPPQRRRTQIRLAQRAYRSRKENAIQSLEKKLQGLQETNEEIGNAFMKLHDCAMAHGVLDMAPGFARELRSTTESILSLVKRLDDGNDGGDDEHTCRVEDSTTPHVSSSSLSRGQTYSSPSPEEVERTKQPEQTSYTPVLGYQFMTESGMMSPFTTTDTPPTILDSSATSSKPVYYGDVNMPMFDDSSFPYTVNADTTLFPDLSSHTPPPAFPPPFPYSPLPAPKTFSFQEATLSRRLSRLSLERGYRLLTMTDPPRAQFARSFGFSLLFQPVEKIRERIRLGVLKSRSESLVNWQAPFWALGGAGQHGDSPFMLPPHPPDADSTAATNSSNSTGDGGGNTISPLTDSVCTNGYVYGGGLAMPTDALERHNLGTNRRFGPFDAKISEIEATQIDSRMRMKMPGFEGDFFDAGDVEQFLRVRGVVVQPGQDYVTAEVDVSLFDNNEERQQEGNRAHGSRGHCVDASAGPSLAPGAGSPPSSPPAVFSWGKASPPPRKSTPLGEGVGGGEFGTTPDVFNAVGMVGTGFNSRQNSVPATFNTRKRVITLDITVFLDGKLVPPLLLGPPFFFILPSLVHPRKENRDQVPPYDMS